MLAVAAYTVFAVGVVVGAVVITVAVAVIVTGERR